MAWFLAISYGIGAPLCAAIEFQDHVVSSRFDIPPGLIYASSAVQVVCALAVLGRRFATLAAAALTAITVGAIIAHVRIESPLTAAPALLYTGVQVAFGLMSRADARER